MSSSTEAISGAMDVHFSLQEMHARNVANIDTPGFKRVLARVGTESAEAGESGSDVPGILGIQLDMAQGPLRHTSNALDLAVQGDGFFTIDSKTGLRYTRNGSFTLDANRLLITQNGDRVLGEGNTHIQIPENASAVRVDKFGNLTVDGQSVAKLMITRFENPDQLRQVGNCLYDGANATPLQGVAGDASGQFQMHQGFLEQSNVNPVGELVNMLASFREYEACARSLKSLEQTASRLYQWARS
jgi:flagellar basal body rod protein FlgG